MPKMLAVATVDEIVDWLSDAEFMGGGVHIDGSPLLPAEASRGWVNYANLGLGTAEERRAFWAPELELVAPAPGQERYAVLRRSESGSWDPNARKANGCQTHQVRFISEYTERPAYQPGRSSDYPPQPFYGGSTLAPAQVQAALLGGGDFVTLIGQVFTLYDARVAQNTLALQNIVSELQSQNQELQEAHILGQFLLQAKTSAGEDGGGRVEVDFNKLLGAFRKRAPGIERTMRDLARDKDLPEGMRHLMYGGVGAMKLLENVAEQEG